MEDNHRLLRPLLDATPPLKLISSNSTIIFRLSLVILIGIVSLWANHEASKGYSISIINESGSSLRFHLFYVSNDEATRIVIEASKIFENFLYPDYDTPTKKPIKRVILRLAKHNLTRNVIVESSTAHEFVLNISPSIMESTNFGDIMVLTVRYGMARIWLWDGQGQTPNTLINGIVEYLVNRPSTVPRPERTEPPKATACWKRRDARLVAEFLSYCERRRPGFIRRLNQAMKDGWGDEKLGAALGLSVQKLCTSYDSLRYNSFTV